MASASTSGASALSLIGISKHYGDVRALDDVGEVAGRLDA